MGKSFSEMVEKAIDKQDEEEKEDEIDEGLNREDLGGKNPSQVPKLADKDKKEPKHKGAKDDPVEKGIKRQDV